MFDALRILRVHLAGRFAAFCGLSLTVAITAADHAVAGAIISPVGAVVDSGGTGGGSSISDTFNQNGLFTPFTSGITDYDSYIASTPLHTNAYFGFEWFSAQFPALPVVVTYDLGAKLTIDAMALWNEEGAGMLTLNLLTSLDGASFSPLVSDLAPIDNPADVYGPQSFLFAPTAAQFVRFVMTGPQLPFDFDGVSIGEVAFRRTADSGTSTVPEPSSLLILFGLSALGVLPAARGRRNASIN